MTHFTSWDINLLLCLVTIFPKDIAEYMVLIARDIHEKWVTDEARKWHQSLRTNQEERWKRIADLSRERKFYKMNASVPITCTLPFDGGMWRNSRDLLKMIRYFREGFIRKKILNRIATERESVSKQIKIVNLLKEDSVRANMFRSRHSLSSIDEALNDLILYTEPGWLEKATDVHDWEELPFIEVFGNIEKIPCKKWNGIGWRYVEDEYPLVEIRN